jgi:hypothetical protein
MVSKPAKGTIFVKQEKFMAMTTSFFSVAGSALRGVRQSPQVIANRFGIEEDKGETQ